MARGVGKWIVAAVLMTAFVVAMEVNPAIDNFTGMMLQRFPYAVKVATQYPIRLLLAPAILTATVIRDNFGWELPRVKPYGVLDALEFVAALIYSWVIWATFFPRFWKFIGRWDPFGWASEEMRPYHLKIWVALMQWSERESEFGKHATGGFAGLIEVLSNRYKRGDIFLGRPKLWIGGMLRPIGIPTQRHFVTIAQTGSGKSVAAMVPNLCLHPANASVLCVDPKGELAAITARRRGQGGGGVRGMGQKVYILNPFHLPILSSFREASYNVFDELMKVAEYDPERPIRYAHKIAQALVPSTSRDPYWDDAPRTFIAGLVLHILQGPPEKRNLIRLREFIMQGDVESFNRLRGNEDDKTNAFDALMVMMENTPEGPYRHVIAGAASALSTMAPNQRGSVMSMAMQHTSFLDVPEIRRASMTSDFLLEDLKRENISVYLCMPLDAVSGIESRWLRMFVLLTVDMMMRVQIAPNPPLLMAIDEFPSLDLKNCGIELIAPTFRSQGVRFWVVGQDIKQFEAVYPDSWESFIGGAEAVQFMGITHPPTVAYISKLLGEHVVTERERQPGAPMRMVKSERPVLDPEQIARLLEPKTKNQIVWRGNARPMLLKITPYFSYMPWWYYSRDRRFRQKFRQWIWRRGSDPVDFTPKKPDKPPDDDGPPEIAHTPEFNFLKEFGRKDIAPPAPLLPPLKAYEPGIKLTDDDKIPGTDTTWKDALARLPGTPLPTKAPPPKSPRPPEKNSDALAELEAMIGLASVKTQVRDTIEMLKLSRARAKKGMKDLGVTNHMVFTGNPGTGKTTVARIVGQVYKDIGMLKTGHLIEATRSDLIAGYVGQTGPKTLKVVEQALGGVLFIDEAYSLTPQPGASIDFAPEAIAALMKAMEDERENLVVIAAGYKEEMAKFIDSNPGLKSRFNTVIEFEDYDSGDLFRILNGMAGANGIRLSADAMEAAAFLMEHLDTGKKGFGNGRAVRNIFEECLRRQAHRFSANSKSDITMFEKSDIPRPGEKDFS